MTAARHRPAVMAAVLAVAVAAWWWTAERMAGMDAGPVGDPGALGWFIGVWTVMMTAMMLPSFAPAVAAYATPGYVGSPRRWLLFACGYVLVWSAAGIAAYGLLALGRGLSGGDLGWSSGGRWLSGATLAIAAVYQATPLKQACLKRCRAPQAIAHGGSRQGWAAALAAGARNAGWCVGCCWALMSALFALGWMNLTWMGLIAALVGLEKLAPSRRPATAATAVVLVALAAGILAAPRDVPGLTVPAPSSSMRAMTARAAAPAGNGDEPAERLPPPGSG